ncbi:MAG: oxygenase MpaB family protein [Mycobacterium sp.]
MASISDAVIKAGRQISEIVLRRQEVLPFDDGPMPDLSPMWAALRADPRAIFNPFDLGWELIRPDFFKKTDFASPPGDPGWFGPDSAAWYVHTHTPTVLLGLINTAIIDIIHQDIQAGVYAHSKLVGRHPDGSVRSGTLSGNGLIIRAGHSFSFFTGVVYGSSATAESLCQTVKAMHHTVKGVRPDGKAYDADDPEFFRWTYASVVSGIAGGHERYHPKPLKGADLDQFYLEYTKVGEALGGTDLPKTKAECRRVLVESPAAASIAINAENIRYVDLLRPAGHTLTRPAYAFLNWLIMDMLPLPAQRVVGFRQPNPVVRQAYRSLAWAMVNTPHFLGELREIEQAQQRVARLAPQLRPDVETAAV